MKRCAYIASERVHEPAGQEHEPKSNQVLTYRLRVRAAAYGIVQLGPMDEIFGEVGMSALPALDPAPLLSDDLRDERIVKLARGLIAARSECERCVRLKAM